MPAINDAFGHLIDLMGAGYGGLVDCVFRAPLVMNDGFCGSNITSLMRNHDITVVKCTNIEANANGEGQVRIRNQELSLDRRLLGCQQRKSAENSIRHRS